MRHTISSRWTFITKFIPPATCVLMSGYWIASALLNGWSDNQRPGWVVLVVWVVVVSSIFFSCAPLKQVAIDDKFIYVSNFINERTVRLEDTEKVTENGWLRHHPVTIHLKAASGAGGRIVFMPTVRLISWFSSHPIIDELVDVIDARRQVAIVAEYNSMKF